MLQTHQGMLPAAHTDQASSTTAAPNFISSSVIVFTTTGCPYCKKAKEALKEQRIPYQDVDVSGNAEVRAVLREATGQRTVPQVFANGVLVGGSEELVKQIGDGSLARLLAQPASSTVLPERLAKAVQAASTQASSSTSSAQQIPPDLQQVLERLADPSTGVSRRQQPQGSAPAAAFTGRALLDWLTKHNDRAAALATAQQLLAANAITLLADKQPAAASVQIIDDEAHWYRLRSQAPRSVAWGAALNTQYWWGPAAARPAEVVAEDLRARILALYDKYLTANGKAVRYKALKQDPEFWSYVDATAELQRVDLSPLSREALMSFAINLYNALVIHALAVHGTQEFSSSTGRIGFFQKAARYNISGHDYVLDDLENGILRGNKPGAASIGMLLKLPGLSKGPFRDGDPRAKHVVSPMDPRIHFALVCGAKSCPPIKLYSVGTIEEGLQAAAEAFCASDVVIDTTARRVTLSKIFSWYYPDFGADKAARLRFLLPYLPQAAVASLEQLLAVDSDASKIKVDFRPYDWGVNAADE
eukprot:gene10520-10680_t